MSKIKLLILKILGFFIPYFKKMERGTILNAINQMMLDYGRAGGYNVNPAVEITSNMGLHILKYEVRLSSGTFIIELESNKGVFSYSYNHDYPKGYSTADHKEILGISIHFDSQINEVKMVEFFGYL